MRVVLLFSALFLAFSCSDDKPTGTSGPDLSRSALIKVAVYSSLDSEAVSYAQVSLYNAVTNAPVKVADTDSNGKYSFSVDTGAYYIRVAAQGYYQMPPQLVSPVPFTALSSDTLTRTYYLDTVGYFSSLGSIAGIVRSDSSDNFAPLTSVLVIAQDSLTGKRFSAVSGAEGKYRVFNLPYGKYSVFGYIAGYKQLDTGRITMNCATVHDTVDLKRIIGGRLTGSITFLAAPNDSNLDITLMDSATGSSIPGLSTNMDVQKQYSINSIPPGKYLAWASYKNDGYVMDPDWLFKNGYPTVTFTVADTLKQLPFSVTDAIVINSPTNPADSLYPVPVDSAVPTFRWTKYPSAKEYIIEVSDLSGRVIWGGFNRSDSTVKHRQITQDASSALFNFDSSATGTLIKGRPYRWKIYADKDAAQKVQGLISSSEDQRGLFILR
ncbi:MAG: carboxypeptidase regulatory-like domain-containing protein [Fibrobacteres bacterium]|nr:carboxypeptidase regulatory-like domain-containing protein [Fibrobacterota bacterium]